MVWRDLGYSVRSDGSIHDLGPLCLQLLEETANLLRAHHAAGAHSCKWFQGPHSIKCLLREHDDHRQVGSPRRHWYNSISFGGPVSGEWRWGRNNPPRPPTFDDIDSAHSV